MPRKKSVKKATTIKKATKKTASRLKIPQGNSPRRRRNPSPRPPVLQDAITDAQTIIERFEKTEQLKAQRLPVSKTLLEDSNYALSGKPLAYYNQSRELKAELPDKTPQSVQKKTIDEMIQENIHAHTEYEDAGFNSHQLDNPAIKHIKGIMTKSDIETLSDKEGATIIEENLENGSKRIKQIKTTFGDIKEFLVPDQSLSATETDEPCPQLFLAENKINHAFDTVKKAFNGYDMSKMDMSPSSFSKKIETLLAGAESTKQSAGRPASPGTVEKPELLKSVSDQGEEAHLHSAADSTAYYDFYDLKMAWVPVWSDIGISQFIQSSFNHLFGPNVDLIMVFLPELEDEETAHSLSQLVTDKFSYYDELLRDSAEYCFSNGCLKCIETKQIDHYFRDEVIDRLEKILNKQAGQLKTEYNLIFSFYNEPSRIRHESKANDLRTKWLANIGYAANYQPKNEFLHPLVDNGYSFPIFAPGTINYGLGITYRQKWEPQAWQVGDMVKTIPLAPKEVRKYKTVIKEHKKRSRKELEKALSAKKEETSDTRRTERDIVARAKESMGFSANVSGGVDFGFADFKASSSFKMNTENDTTNTMKQFRESVKKAIEETKNEKEVEIIEEDSIDFESESSSTISNPNEELTVTYMFYQLQRQYRVSESLHNVDSVILIAEEVVALSEMEEDHWGWLRDNEWILKRVLLDDSFLPALDIVRYGNNAMKEDVTKQEEKLASIKSVIDNASKILEKLDQQENAATTSLQATQAAIFQVSALPPSGYELNRNRLLEALVRDMGITGAIYENLEEAQKQVKEELKVQKNAFDRATDDYINAKVRLEKSTREVDRLIAHIRDNIMYYQQSIWAHEPPDQRYLRLFNKKVPFFKYPEDRTEIVVEFDEALVDLQTLEEGMPFRVVLPPLSELGDLEDSYRSLDEVADLNNLLGFRGNFLVFPLRQQSYITAYLAQDYFGSSQQAVNPSERNHTGLTQSQHSDLQPINQWDEIEEMLITWIEPEVITVIKDEVNKLSKLEQWVLLNKVLQTHLTPRNYHRFLSRLKRIITNEQWNALEILFEKGRAPDYESKTNTLNWLVKEGLAKPLTKPEKMVIPMNGLFMEALVGKHPLLEDFKLKHRGIDAEKARAELHWKLLENIRLESRIMMEDFDDPEIEKIVKVESDDTTKNLIIEDA